mmetsp:Transcript_2331/g.1676  ORF Transcript_2331/g.1676 Transcript_2331/m.1676 type:complete len:222 (-) Transcript_2331:53-718(-)|eukprot:CAMPEP_0202971882 /NCGR_PEP_ID=MMETSP1396-20130829/31873_1 /ASSEMBLY_ACC=CAM_ASM_000872 /TAXON_ID= /ORGANISM="Pseudokeronopsis sp., Strain Brazil" /LENGTH=221 /DNA_ID=CAMNT_0049701735 /DNA_START=37 /DNA_END=702 /DNA_ORIENTATION=+
MPAFKIFDTVNTIYGTGFISAVRPDCYVVQLTNWALAQGQSPTLYLQEDAIKPIPGAFPHTTVATTYGPARIESIRADNVHIAKPINWKLANNSCATLYLQPDGVKLNQTPGFIPGDEVMTVYGQGFVEAKREKDLVVKLRNWKLAQGQSPTLYLQPTACVKIPGLAVGDSAKTVWGMVKILEVRRDGTHVCKALHWKLANNSAPTLYLAPEAFALLSIKP